MSKNPVLSMQPFGSIGRVSPVAPEHSHGIKVRDPESPKFYLVGTDRLEHGAGFALPWKALVARILREMGFEPGDRITIRKLDGSELEMSFLALDEEACEEVQEK